MDTGTNATRWSIYPLLHFSQKPTHAVAFYSLQERSGQAPTTHIMHTFFLPSRSPLDVSLSLSAGPARQHSRVPCFSLDTVPIQLRSHAPRTHACIRMQLVINQAKQTHAHTQHVYMCITKSYVKISANISHSMDRKISLQPSGKDELGSSCRRTPKTLQFDDTYMMC